MPHFPKKKKKKKKIDITSSLHAPVLRPRELRDDGVDGVCTDRAARRLVRVQQFQARWGRPWAAHLFQSEFPRHFLNWFFFFLRNRVRF
jgi:hypothetical protein